MSNPYAQFNDPVIDEFRSSGGTVGRFGRALVLLHHIGAKSGEDRVTPVMGLRDGDTWLVAASKAGADDNPAWYHNLLAHPEVEIETPDDGTVAVRATDLKGAERDAAWARFLAASPGFRSYEERTSRVIPVLRLARR
jgi:deazaflavin-dependent oxidoreductase (nitroreductase family)